MIVSQTILFKFLDKKTNIYIAVFKNFWPDGKMVDQLPLAVLYELTLKFVKKMKNLHPIDNTQRKTYEFKIR